MSGFNEMFNFQLQSNLKEKSKFKMKLSTEKIVHERMDKF